MPHCEQDRDEDMERDPLFVRVDAKENVPESNKGTLFVDDHTGDVETDKLLVLEFEDERCKDLDRLMVSVMNNESVFVDVPGRIDCESDRDGEAENDSSLLVHSVEGVSERINVRETVACCVPDAPVRDPSMDSDVVEEKLT